MTLVDEIESRAALFGLNLVAAVPAEKYNRSVSAELTTTRISSTARSIVVIGNGGPPFWNSFRQHCQQHPDWTTRKDPLDDFTRTVVENELLPVLQARRIFGQIVYPFSSERSLNFIELAKVSGLGGPSILGVLVHPVFGPWIAFRAALLFDLDLDRPGTASGFDPCPTCTARSCIPACPVNAVTIEKGWDVLKCVEHRVEVEPDCASRCHARVACVLGPENRYRDDEIGYHQQRALNVMRPYYLARIKPAR